VTLDELRQQLQDNDPLSLPAPEDQDSEERHNEPVV
jgi:hypothetical protein